MAQEFQQWRESLKPIKIDIVSDFSGRGVFAIHGEALLSYCLDTSIVDFRYGFQLLHAVHAVEAFLAKLKDRGCGFHLVWFEDQADVCMPRRFRKDGILVAKYRLARAVLIQHFASMNPEGQESNISFSFPSLESEQFSSYLDTHPLHFFLGSSAYDESKDPSPEDSPLRVLYLMAAAGCVVAFIQDVEFKSSKAYLDMATPSGHITPLAHKPVKLPQPSPAVIKAMERLAGLEQAKGLSAREVISIGALSAALSSGSREAEAASVLLHLVVMKHSSLTQRGFANPEKTGAQSTDPGTPAQEFLQEFFDAARDALAGWFGGEFKDRRWDAYDLFDGRLYNNVKEQLSKITALPKELSADLAKLSGILKAVSNTDIPDKLTKASGSPPSKPFGKSDAVSPPPAVLPFKHPVVDKYLSHVKLDTTGVLHESATAPKIFHELTHWHNAKKPLDPKAIAKPPGFWARKRNQKFMADTIAYSASLTGAAGKNIDPETIVVFHGPAEGRAAKAPAPKQAQPQVKPQSKGPKKKEAPKSNKQKALETSEARRLEKLQVTSQAAISVWKERCPEFEKQLTMVKSFLKAERYYVFLSSTHRQVVGSEVLLYLSNVLLRIQGNPKTPRPSVPAILAMLWSKASEASKLPLTEEVKRQLTALEASLRIPLQFEAQAVALKRPLAFKPVDIEKRLLPSGTDPKEFQLDHCGPYMERSFDSQPDPRVPFDPDAWQRKVLDAIDENKSVLAVAPTSAGKTFISFYAMKKVLQANDDDVLVYVAPTKALVNQIAAEVQARFSKNYHHREGKSVWAIHTRDYRVNSIKGAQVLVTVPEVLQTLLLSPSNANGSNAFSKRIKRIIFDEVHSIGQSEEGIIWEQLLLMAPCPIIALSATVANPTEFKDWLERAQKTKGFEMEMIVHTSRYSDLRKFIHDPPEDVSEFKGVTQTERLPLPGLDSEGTSAASFMFVHPVGGMVDKNRDALNDANLEPRDCLTLWNTMKQLETPEYPVDKALDPEKALPELIKKADIVKWEKALKEQLAKWMADSKSPFDTLRSQLRGERYTKLAASHADIAEAAEENQGPIVSTRSAFGLIQDLRATGALPAIFFNYDRSTCESIALQVIGTLKAAEEKFQAADPSWVAKMAEYERWKKAAEAAKSKIGKKTSKGRDEDAEGKADAARDSANRDVSKWESFNPDLPLPQFSFADTTKMTNEELEDRLYAMNARETNPAFIDALRRGVGVHHAGMNRQYRQVVEILFRKGYLTVIVATGTLAMGINMPCRTVVFTGDSIYLTALNYRQASGRAGRRGFDVLGNVIFHDMHPHRALEIMSAKLPDLRGQFPVSVTLILRLFTLLHGTQNSEFAANAVKSLLTQNRLYLGGPDARMTISHHLRFSIEYLRRQNLLSEKGAPLNFSGLVGHLHYTENAVFAFHALLKEGYFHELCANISNPAKQKDILLEIVLTLCHLFARIPCKKYSDESFLKEHVHRSASMVILPNLPPKAATILENHNKETLGIFHGYVSTYAAQYLAEEPDNELPLTKHKVEPVANPVDVSVFLPCQPPTTSRSPFVALSGFGDDFSTIKELCETVRAGVFLEESAIPYIPIAPKETCGQPWNAYLLDFFKHGDVVTLARDNGIKSSVVWFLLKDFSMIIDTIITSLENFLDPNAGDDEDIDIPLDSRDVVEGVPDVVDETGRKFGAMKVSAPAAVAPAAAAAKPEKKMKKKKVVAASWDDEEEEESEPDNWDDEDEEESEEESPPTPPTEAAGSGVATPLWSKDDGQSLVKVCEAFKLVREQFDEKFKKMWA